MPPDQVVLFVVLFGGGGGGCGGGGCGGGGGVAVVLTLTLTIKSVVTGEAPVTLEWSRTPGKNTQTKLKVVHAYSLSWLTQFMTPPKE